MPRKKPKITPPYPTAPKFNIYTLYYILLLQHATGNNPLKTTKNHKNALKNPELKLLLCESSTNLRNLLE